MIKMDIQELTSKAKEAAKNRTSEQRLQLLKNADILDEEGNFLTMNDLQKALDKRLALLKACKIKPSDIRKSWQDTGLMDKDGKMIQLIK